MKIKKYIIPILLTASVIGVTSCRKNKPTESTDPTESEESSSSSSLSSTIEDYKGAALTQITVGAHASKTSYSLGETLNTDNLYVNAVFADGQLRSLVKSQYSIDASEFRNDREGVYNIHVIYNQGTIRKTATYQVTVASILNKLSEKYLLGITASGMKTDYMYKDNIDTTGLKVVATYSDYSEVDVTSKVTQDFNQYNANQMGTYMLKFSYSETYTLGSQSETKTSSTFLLATVDANLSKIELESGTVSIAQDTVGPDGTLTSIDMSDWKVKATFTNGEPNYDETTAYVSPSELTLTGFNSGMTGKQTATLSYTHGSRTKTCKVEITVNATKDADYTFNASSLPQANNTKISGETVIDDILSAGDSCQVKDDSKTFGDMSFTKRIQTNGGGKADTKNYIKFTLTRDCTVAIIGKSSAANKLVTTAGFYDANNKLVSDSYEYSLDISKYKYELKAGTYYFFDPSFAVQIYAIQIWYK